MPEAPENTPQREAAPDRVSRLQTWGELLRVGNLLTVPGDPLAGMLLVIASGAAVQLAGGRAALAAVASLMLYAAGLLQNDYWDRDVDARERPSRPLPSGRARAGSVISLAFILAGLGVVAARVASLPAGIVAAVLLVTMTAYNLGGKRVGLVGPTLMGLCRGMSLLIGAAAVGTLAFKTPGVWICIGGLSLYVGSVTAIAAREAQPTASRQGRFLPALALLAWFGALYAAAAPPSPVAIVGSLILAAGAIVWSLACGASIHDQSQPVDVQQTVGRLIRGLLLIQAALAATTVWPGFLVAGGLLACWPAVRRLSRRFPPS